MLCKAKEKDSAQMVNFFEGDAALLPFSEVQLSHSPSGKSRLVRCIK